MSRVRATWNGPEVERALHDGAVDGLRRSTEYVLSLSTARVPIEEGTLSRSGVASVDPVALRGAVSYDTPYAARQHEELTWRHDPGRTAKYLEQPLIESQQTVHQLFAASLRRALRDQPGGGSARRAR